MSRITGAFVCLAILVAMCDTARTAETSLDSHAPLDIRDVTVFPESPRTGERLTLTVDLTGTWDNPYLTEEIALEAAVSCPSGTEYTMPGFLNQEFDRTNEGTADSPKEMLTPIGEPVWQVRLMPRTPGVHTIMLRARDRSGTVEHSVPVTVGEGTEPRFLRVSPRDPYSFAFDDGSPWLAIGLNVCWYRGEQGTYDYDDWFPMLAKNGGNYARIWQTRWAFGIEPETVGVYRQDQCFQFDRVLELAEREGIHIKLCFENQHDFNHASWPYDCDNGGPCLSKMDFFTSEKARDLWRNRLRYIVARWGYSQHIMAWELWNEIEDVRGYTKDTVHPWTREMCRYLKDIDPYDHMTVSSLGAWWMEPTLWIYPELDFAQMHGYHLDTLQGIPFFSRDFAHDWGTTMINAIGVLRSFKKPALFGEFGIIGDDYGHTDRWDGDPEGVHLHNGIWGGLMGGGAGTGHVWFWDSYVAEKNLWYHYRAVADITADIDWPGERFQPVDIHTITPVSLRVHALVGDTTTLLWVRNRAHTWWNVVQRNPVIPVADTRIVLPELHGDCSVTLWDPWTAERVWSREVSGGDDGLVIEPGTVERDVVIVVTRQ